MRPVRWPGQTLAERILRIGEFDLVELRALIGHAALYIGGDSGPLHIAGTTRTPVVGLFGPTLAVRSLPWRDPAVPALGVEPGPLACRPCDQRACVPGDFRCLTATPPERVIDAAERALGHGEDQEMTTLTLVAGAPPRDRLEWAAVAGLLGFVSALQLSIAAASICLAITLSCWAGALVLGQERWDAPAVLLAAAGLCGLDADLGSRLARPAHQLHRFQATGRLPPRARGVSTGPGQPRADDLQRDHHGGRRQRHSWHRPVRVAQLRPPRPAAPGRDGALHDLLGSAGAGHRRRRRRGCCSTRAIARGPPS